MWLLIQEVFCHRSNHRKNGLWIQFSIASISCTARSTLATLSETVSSLLWTLMDRKLLLRRVSNQANVQFYMRTCGIYRQNGKREGLLGSLERRSYPGNVASCWNEPGYS